MPTVFVDEELMRSLREVVLERYGKLYGKIKEEVDEAIRGRIDALKIEAQSRPRPIAA